MFTEREIMLKQSSKASMKELSIPQQTRALLHKNLLKKWRMKRESLVEWSIPIIIGLYMGLLSYFKENNHVPEVPPQHLGSIDEFNGSSITVVYTPISNTTQQIMNKTSFAPTMKGTRIIGVPSVKDLDEVLLENIPHALGIVFNDTFSYKLKVYLMYGNPFLKEDLLEVTTNHSVMAELMSVDGINMKTLPFISKDIFQYEVFILFCLLYFSSFVYFASRNVTKERKQYKELMKVMGLQDSAFWLSWGLIYVGFIFIISIFIAIIITSSQIIVMTGFLVIFTLFFLYGLSLIAVTFLMAVLLQKAVLSNLMVFLFTLFWGCVGFTVLHKELPSSLEWVLSICSPFAFTSGMAKIIFMDYNLNGAVFPDPSGESYVMIAIFFILAFDGLLYLVLALYFDKILLSLELRTTNRNKIIERDIDPELPSDEYFEPVDPEYQGKEAIRIRNIKKEYKGKSGKVEALKGKSWNSLCRPGWPRTQKSACYCLPSAGIKGMRNHRLAGLYFDIYESQITAILGHSGAGKSSLLNILSGLYVPTAGSVTVYNKNLSEMQDLKEIQKMIGVCPQHNVQFDVLTVKENLTLFAKIKGILPQDVEQEVQQIILELDMQNIQDDLAEHLSEGQKRKLTFGIAILGDPQILLLDEPTAGLDPFSRQRIWGFLKEHRADHVILFSTQFTDEADILAGQESAHLQRDSQVHRVLCLSEEKMGSWISLKFLFMDETCDPEQLASFINHHIPDAKLKAKNKEKLEYILPLERTNKFPEFFSDLDKYAGQGLMNYEVSMSTLNEVFIKLEGEPSTTQDFEKRETVTDSESLNEMEVVYPSLSQAQKTLSTMSLWRMQVCAIARLRILKLKRDRKAVLIFLLLIGIALLPLIMENMANALIEEKKNWEFKSDLYFLSPGQLPQGLRTSLLVINNTDSNIEDFVQALKHQNIVLEVDDFENRNGTESLSYNGAIIVSGRQKDYRFSAVCNTKRLHCFPILMNVISNGILHMFNHSQYIRIEEDIFSSKIVIVWFGTLEASLFILFILCSVSPHIAMSSVSDYKKKADSQLISLAFGCAASLVFLMYVISFVFCKKRKNSGLWSICFFIVITITFDTVLIDPFNGAWLISAIMLVPSFSLNALLIVLEMRAYQYYEEFGERKYGLSGVDLLLCLVPYFHTLLFIFVLRCLELKRGKNVLRKDPIFRISPQSLNAQSNPEEPTDEDDDVQVERLRTSNALSTLNLDEKPVIIASCLHKEYAGQKKRCCSRRTRKVAPSEGEILGLLGPDGAGKSSAIRMIAGITKPTAGEVELKRFSSAVGHRGDGTAEFGYCPQENVLWPILTVKEHLEVYATVKGLRKEDAVIAISRALVLAKKELVNAFKLHGQLNVQVRNLEAGVTRKMCFALSILGNSPLLILDEPSAGLDVSGKQQVWQAIQAAVKDKGKGVLLSTHDLAEAEALCDRAAIMVSGRLRCVGSIQHLKRKFGKDYFLELRVKEISQEPLVHREILKLFPQAARQDSEQDQKIKAATELEIRGMNTSEKTRHKMVICIFTQCFSLLTYKLPVMEVHPLSQAFHKLEAVKHGFNLEDYNLSQCTLDRVFLELSKEQESGDVHEEEDTALRRKLLPPSDEL
ncbi:ATP-binding cassette sub-family A member 6 [Apodemus speciosus]|uniref:ATP-binding cassette sub-family A member 6 n=1 Tax=Apodemus speciosus TaxID=105296 RepID=A0ABQ0FCP8_APOSI